MYHPRGSFEGRDYGFAQWLILMWEPNLRVAIGEVDCLEIVNTLHDDRFEYQSWRLNFLRFGASFFVHVVFSLSIF